MIKFCWVFFFFYKKENLFLLFFFFTKWKKKIINNGINTSKHFFGCIWFSYKRIATVLTCCTLCTNPAYEKLPECYRLTYIQDLVHLQEKADYLQVSQPLDVLNWLCWARRLTALRSLVKVTWTSPYGRNRFWAPLCPWRWWFLGMSTSSQVLTRYDSSPPSPRKKKEVFFLVVYCFYATTSGTLRLEHFIGQALKHRDMHFTWSTQWLWVTALCIYI